MPKKKSEQKKILIQTLLDMLSGTTPPHGERQAVIRKEQMRYYYGMIIYHTLADALSEYRSIKDENSPKLTVTSETIVKAIVRVLTRVLGDRDAITVVNNTFGITSFSYDSFMINPAHFDQFKKNIDDSGRMIQPEIQQAICKHASELDPTNPITYTPSTDPSAESSETAPPAHAEANRKGTGEVEEGKEGEEDEEDEVKEEGGVFTFFKKGVSLARSLVGHKDPNAELKPISPAGVAVAGVKAGTQAVAGGDLEPIEAQKRIRGKKHNIDDYKEVKADLRKTLDAGFDKNAVEELDLLEREVLNGKKKTKKKTVSLAIKPIDQKIAIAEKVLDESIGAKLRRAFNRTNSFKSESNSEKLRRVFSKKKLFK